MANEAKFTYGTQKTLEASGASVSASGFAQADDANLTSTDTADYLLLDLAFSGAFSVAPTAGEVLNVYAQPLNFDGTNDAPSPSTSYLGTYVGSFLLAATTSTQYLFLGRVPLPAKECAFWVENKSAQTLSSGWTLKATPVTYAPT